MSTARPDGPLVTVGLAVYNGERFVANALDSLLAQTYANFVVLISDNASTDGTREICQRYASLDSRISYHRNASNIGLAGNYNLLVSKCRTRYFRWAPADDYTSPDMLADAVRVMEDDPSLSLCYPRAYFVNAEGKEIGQWQDELHLLQDDPVERFERVVTHISKVHHHLGLMRFDSLRRTMLFRAHPGADFGLIAEMSIYGKFYQIPKLQFYRRMHEDSSSWAPFDDKHQARRYMAAGKSKTPFTRWRIHATYVSAVRRSPLSAYDRARAYRFLLANAWKDRGWLADEFVRDSRRVLVGGGMA